MARGSRGRNERLGEGRGSERGELRDVERGEELNGKRRSVGGEGNGS